MTPQGRAVVVDDDTFRTSRESKRKVHNTITSTFEFRGGRIVKQVDKCDAAVWARQAFGEAKGLLSGHIGFLRRRAAMKKLDNFIAQKKRSGLPRS